MRAVFHRRIRAREGKVLPEVCKWLPLDSEQVPPPSGTLSSSCYRAKSPQSCPLLCDPMDYSLSLSMGFFRQEY